MPFRLGALVLCATLWLPWPAARASGLIADLSHHLIAITTAFSGSNVLLFGALEEAGGDVAVVVRGPAETLTVRRKGRIGPVWLNTDEAVFREVPTFYAVAANRPLQEIALPDQRERFRIGSDRLRLDPVDAASRSSEDRAAFRAALIRNMEADGLYAPDLVPLRFLGDKLFRTTLAFPANVPPGNYQVEVLQLRDGLVVGAQTSVLVISKVGLEAEIYDAARVRPALYGAISVLLAVGAGWTAGLVFRKS